MRFWLLHRDTRVTKYCSILVPDGAGNEQEKDRFDKEKTGRQFVE